MRRLRYCVAHPLTGRYTLKAKRDINYLKSDGYLLVPISRFHYSRSEHGFTKGRVTGVTIARM